MSKAAIERGAVVEMGAGLAVAAAVAPRARVPMSAVSVAAVEPVADS